MYSELIYHQTIYTAALLSCWNYQNVLSDTQNVSWPEITLSTIKCLSSGCMVTEMPKGMQEKLQGQ